MTDEKLLEIRDWHSRSVEETSELLDSPSKGLTQEEVRRRLEVFGRNRLTPPKRRSASARFFSQFTNVLIFVLLGASVVTAVLGEWVDTGVILGVVLINAIIGFIQEGKAEAALEAIRKMLSLQASVQRDGRRLDVPAEELVPGDLVFLASGDKVPADLRLVRTKSLQLQESALTGESMPVEKSEQPVAPDAPLGDRTSMAYSSTLVTYGQGTGIVVASGDRTEIGRISSMLSQVEPMQTPLLAKMAVFGRWLTVAILALTAAIFAVGVLWRGYPVPAMFLAAVGIAVAAIPEGLPVVMTITLAIGVTRMARRNAIIRRLPAVETLGSVSVICSDKTGTLTRNELTVRAVRTAQRVYEVSGTGYAPRGAIFRGEEEVSPEAEPVLLEMARAAVLCNDASLHEEGGHWTLQGDPTDGALLTFGMKSMLDPKAEGAERPRDDLIPFESEHKFMATLHHDHHGRGEVFVKGAPEQVLAMCSRQRCAGRDAPFDPAAWRRCIDEMAAEGQRIIAVAVKPAHEHQHELDFEDVGELTLLGLFGLIDPPREEAIEAVAVVQRAGIAVKMITGDHVVTARAIGEQFGITRHGGAMTGHQIDQLDDHQLERAARETSVFARASPEHKIRLVRALQSKGEVVSMTGDGVNDAPALKRANVGVAMGIKGTEAAKEAASMVLADDNFATIAHAVEEGRTIFDNLRKAILFILPTNGGQALIVLVAVLLGMTLPITPVQILWVNMVTAVTLGLALAFEPPEADVMRRPPRSPTEPLLSGYFVWRIGYVALLLLAGSFGMFLWALSLGSPLAAARTVAVNTVVMGEVFYLISSRAILGSVLSLKGFFGSRPVLVSIAVIVALQLVFTYAPFMHRLFATGAIGLREWGAMVGVGVAILLLVELEKLVVRRVKPPKSLASTTLRAPREQRAQA